MLLEGRIETTSIQECFRNKIYYAYLWFRYGAEEHRPYSTTEYLWSVVVSIRPATLRLRYHSAQRAGLLDHRVHLEFSRPFLGPAFDHDFLLSEKFNRIHALAMHIAEE